MWELYALGVHRHHVSLPLALSPYSFLFGIGGLGCVLSYLSQNSDTKAGCFALCLVYAAYSPFVFQVRSELGFYCFFTIFWGHYGLWLTHLFYLDLWQNELLKARSYH
jgi:hypothetical protein